MPAAAVTAAAAVAGGVISAHSAGQANKAQSQANKEALDFERQKYERSQAEAKAQWDAKQAMKVALMRRYGINVPAQPFGGTAPAASSSPMNLGTFAAGRFTPPTPPTPTSSTATMPPGFQWPGGAANNPNGHAPTTLGSLWNWNGDNSGNA